MPIAQRGISFSGFLIGAFLLVLASVVGLKALPAYMENMKIQSTFESLANDPELSAGSILDIRSAFTKRASIDDIHAIGSQDIEISKDGAKLVLSSSYSITIPLAGNVSLLLDFNPSSGR